MSKSASTQTLRRANPRLAGGFAETVDRFTSAVPSTVAGDSGGVGSRRRLRTVHVSLAGAAAVVVASASLTIGPPGGGPAIEEAAAAVQRAAVATTASAASSGTAVVRITHDGEAWAGTTVRWNGDDLAVTPVGGLERGLIVVQGTMYGFDPGDGGWFELGPPSSVDPGSGTTPREYLVAVKEDVGGTTLRRLTGGTTFAAPERLDDGSTRYAGTIAAGDVAREAGFKDGRALRVLPFGFVANGAASDPTALLDVVLTVGADGLLSSVVASWENWRFSVSYRGLGSTPAPVAPDDAKPLKR